MIDRRFEAIENDENQELSKMLACAEQHLTCVEFGRKLLYMASQGRADQSFLLCKSGSLLRSAVAVLLRDCWRAHPEADSTANLDPARHGCGGHRWLVE